MKAKRLISIVLCLCLFAALIPAAMAEEGDPITPATGAEPVSDKDAVVPDASAAPESAADRSIIDADALQTLLEDYLQSKGIKSENVSVGYCYTGTGDEWYYNGDSWHFAASVYKVPLMMLLAEKVHNGEYSQNSNIGGLSVDDIEKYVIVNSNNDYAIMIRSTFGGDEVWREEAKKFSDLAEEDYSPDYLVYGYMNCRYIVDVLQTLYAEPERFPKVLDYMGEVKPGEYMRTHLEDVYPVCQKWGSLIEQNGRWNNHAAGIVYMPNPIIVSIMTVNVDDYSNVIGDITKLLSDYTLSLDEQYSDFVKDKAEAIREEETAQLQAIAEEQRALEEAIRKEAEEKAAKEQQQQQELRNKAKAEQKEKLTKVLKTAGIALAALALVIVVIIVLGRINRKNSPDEPGAKKGFGWRRADDLDDDDFDDEDFDDEDFDDEDFDEEDFDDEPARKKLFGKKQKEPYAPVKPAPVPVKAAAPAKPAAAPAKPVTPVKQAAAPVKPTVSTQTAAPKKASPMKEEDILASVDDILNSIGGWSDDYRKPSGSHTNAQPRHEAVTAQPSDRYDGGKKRGKHQL